MPDSVVRVVDAYPYRQTADAAEFLLLRRSPDVDYAGQWRMVGGTIEPGEAAWETALREMKEETGQTPERFWSVPSTNTFYEWKHDRVNLIPVFAAELSSPPVLDAEHDAFAWLDVETAADRLSWPEQQRLLRLVARLLREGVPPSLLIDPED
jgi:dATP pyrophosphohydrolase